MTIKDNHNHSILPENVMVDILARLSTKPLIRFKSVCKSWYTLIGSSYFIQQHYNHENNRARLLLYHCETDKKHVFSLYSESFSRHDQPNHLQFPHDVSIVGPINSIFCVIVKNGDGPVRLTLWNPAIREFRPLPPASPNIRPNYSASVNSFGFGLDQSNDDYKVVWIRKLYDPSIDPPLALALISIYNLQTDSWRYFKDVDFSIVVQNIIESKCNTYVNEAYYWLADDAKLHYYILRFDMKTEKFVELEVPNWITNLFVSLCIYYDDIGLISLDEGMSIGLWVRKDEGVWVRQLVLAPDLFSSFCWPFGVWENGELIMETNSADLILLNPNTNQVINLYARSDSSTHVCCYKESLVSIKRKWH